ncbi:MFAP1 domain-containing protein [Meloidogyne graminicola]|uniref:MFAP1 domain-containing protein n=1 Tax=Meloidogyne graminicola TaxID=189291 RepID=A0A8S9ZKB2_9BILA|nr:MFAP1 domain-containing protein [Meloidogyne graminicola]
MGDFVPKFERNMELKILGPRPLSTAGAIPVKDDKGRIVMKKVKVQRYMAGKIPEFARDVNSDEDNVEEEEEKQQVEEQKEERSSHRQRHRESDSSSSRHHHNRRSDHRHRSYEEAERKFKREVKDELGLEEEEALEPESASEDERELEERHRRALERRQEIEREEQNRVEQEEPDEYADEEVMQRRRELLRIRRRRQEEQELLARQKETEEVGEEESEEEESSEEEEDESDDEIIPRLKPVFVPKTDRVTLVDVDKEQEGLEKLRKLQVEEKRRQTIKMVEERMKYEAEIEKAKKEESAAKLDLTAIDTDDESEQIAYEMWKIREIKRLRRNRDERETMAREKEEMERIHAMTEEERREYMRLHPKLITNEQRKGKYKFLQKYYHRGVFFLDKEDDVLKRNFAEATGEDVFDKSVLPKVMQVKNFGKASRSKWTHLTAEDTTDHQGVWATPTPLSAKFVTKHAAGMKPIFERPITKKRKVGD